MRKKTITPKDPMTRNALKALQEAVAQVVEEHRRDGRPLAIWRDGKVVWVEPEPASIVRERPAKYRTRTHGKKASQHE